MRQVQPVELISAKQEPPDHAVDSDLTTQRTGIREKHDKKPTQAQLLLALAEPTELWHCPDGLAYGTFEENDHRETRQVRSSGFRNWLTHRFYQQTQSGPNAQAMEEALRTIEAKARYSGNEHKVYIRVAEYGGAFYLDLCNQQWSVVEVTAAGWRIVPDAPVRFRRAKGMLPLPLPVAVGSVEELRRFLNLPDEKSWRLVVAWLVQALKASGPYPILILEGEQGSAKSTAARVLRSLVDPNTATLRTAPRKERDLVIAGNNAWILNFDNLSGLPPWLSDGLCRLATGGGFATRQLYTDHDEVLFAATRPVVLNGIDQVATRHDLLDRSIIVTLPVISDEQRRSEEGFWGEFEDARPRILGGLLYAVSAGLRNLPTTTLERLPRMADFALWVAAAEEGLPWASGGFVDAYTGNRADAVSLAVESDLVAMAVMDFMQSRDTWCGTASNLLEDLDKLIAEKPARTDRWPKQPNSLTRRLRRCATFLRRLGVEVNLDKRDQTSNRTRLVTLRKNQQNIVRIVQPSNDDHEAAPEANLVLDDKLDNEVELDNTIRNVVQRDSAPRAGLDSMDDMDDEESPFSRPQSIWQGQRKVVEV
jgi:hypothetical protein